MNQNVYGYMRVSTAEQNEARQRIELEKWGIPIKNIFIDRLSGKNFNRPAYQKLKKKLKKNDLLVVKSIDRFGRNYADIQSEWNYITKKIQADILILDMPLLDTRKGKDLTGTLIADIVLQLLSYVAETERNNIRQRQAEGIAAARARGVHLGRKRKPIPNQFYAIYNRWSNKMLTRGQAAEELGITIHQFDWMRKKCVNHK